MQRDHQGRQARGHPLARGDEAERPKQRGAGAARDAPGGGVFRCRLGLGLHRHRHEAISLRRQGARARRCRLRVLDRAALHGSRFGALPQRYG